MREKLRLWGCVLVLAGLAGGNSTVVAQEPSLFQKFCGRVGGIYGLRADYPNPAALIPEDDGDPGTLDDCGNGLDDDADTTIDYLDTDCQGGLGPQNVYLKTPFDVIQAHPGFAAARYTGADRDANAAPELLINSTGPGGRKLSYLRTDGRNIYSSVRVRVVVMPGTTGDNGGPIAVRIQAADAGATANKSYYVKVVPGTSVSINKDQGDGTSVVLASADRWTSTEAIEIRDFDPSAAECYSIDLTAEGASLSATISQVDCAGFIRNIHDTINNRTVSIQANDADLAEGYIGLRSDADAGGAVIDDAASAAADPSVLEYIVDDPDSDVNPNAPRIAFFNSYSSNNDGALDYTTTPITPRDDNVYNRSGITLADASLAAYLRSLGFQVDEFPVGAFPPGITTPEELNANYDLFWLPSSGGSADSRDRAIQITIPFIFAEHVDGHMGFAGLWAGTGSLNGNQNQNACGQTAFSATLNGAQEAPNPVITDATGFGILPYDAASRTLSYNISYSGLSSAETAAHIHNAPAGVAGDVIHPLPAANPKVGSVVLSETEAAELLAGNLYVNIHTSMHPGGEIRGQLVPATLSNRSVRLVPEENGGNPDHPLIRGLADENGDIELYDSAQIPLNSLYPVPGEGPAGLSGAGFKGVKQTLDERGWGPGHRETQFAGYPTTEGAFALASEVNPCNGESLWTVDEAGTLTSAQGHIFLVAAEAGTPRLVSAPEACPGDCTFESRTIFYGFSDRAFPFATKDALSIFRRMALWALGLLDSENRSDIPFLRADSNSDGRVDISDVITTLGYLFQGNDTPTCLDAADTNDDERLDISDPINTLSFLFQGGLPPAFPLEACYLSCGLDLTPAGPGPGQVEDPSKILSCKAYAPCRS